MGMTKDYMMALEEERFEAWAAEYHPDVEPDTPEWELIGQYYSDWQDFMAEQAYQEYQQEKFAASLNNVHERYKHAILELRRLYALLDITQPEIVYRIAYVHAVTVMEAYLMYCARALLEHEWPLRRFLEVYYLQSENISKKSKQSARVMDLSLFRPLARMHVSRMTFHNVRTIESYFGAVLHVPPVWPLDPLAVITQCRNDLVHRNGVAENDVPFDISPQQLRNGLRKVHELIDAADLSMRQEVDLFGDWRTAENRKIIATSLSLSLPGDASR